MNLHLKQGGKMSASFAKRSKYQSRTLYSLHIMVITLSFLIIFTDQISTSPLPNEFGTRTVAMKDPIRSAVFNVSVTLVQGYPPSIRVSWNLTGSSVPNVTSPSSSSSHITLNQIDDGNIESDRIGSRIKTFQVSYHPIFSRFRQIFEVPPFVRNVTLEHLIPNQEYKLEIAAFTESNVKITSQVIRFITPPNEYRFGRFKGLKTEQLYRSGINESKGVSIKMDEAVIVVFVLCFWMAVIALFCNKWGKIRHLEPYHPEYKEEPEPEPFPSPVYSIHPRPSRMNTCTSSNVGPTYAVAQIPGSRFNLSFERRRTCSQGSRIGSLYQCGSACVYGGNCGTGASPSERTRQASFCGQMVPGSFLTPSPMRGRNNSTICIQSSQSEYGPKLNTHRGSCMMLSPNQVLSDTRRIKSAEDLKSLVIQSLKASSRNHFRFPLGTLPEHKQRRRLKKCGAIDFSR